MSNIEESNANHAKDGLKVNGKIIHYGSGEDSMMLQSYMAYLLELSPGGPELANCLDYIGLMYGLASVVATPYGDSELPGRYCNLAVFYRNSYRSTGDLQDLEAALKYSLEAVGATPVGHLDLPGQLQTLAACYNDEYRRSGDVKNIEAALMYGLATVAATPDGHPDLPINYNTLAISFTDRYRRIGNLQDLGLALKYGLAAVVATPEGHSGLPGQHQTLAASYNDMYRRTGNIKDVNNAIKHGIAAVETTPEDHPDLPMRHNALAIFYTDRYRRTGNPEDLEAALKYDLATVSATPEGHPDLPGWQRDLAISYQDRYRRAGDLQDLEAALQHSLAAIAVIPEGHSDLPDQYCILATCYGIMYQKNGNLQDLEARLQYALAAVTAMPKGHPNLSHQYQTLATSYVRRYRRTRYSQDLEAGLKYSHEALASTPEGHTYIPAQHQNLAMFYRHQYRFTQELQDLEAALKHGVAAVESSPEGHPALPLQQALVAKLYIDRYKSNTVSKEDLANALHLFQQALQSPTAAPHDIWYIAVFFCQKKPIFQQQHILQVCSTALNILPSLLWLGSSIGLRHDILLKTGIPNFISTAVATALQASETELAVEFLEQGLSTIHQQMMQLKLENAKLDAELPLQSCHLHQLSVQLQSSYQLSNATSNHHLLAHKRLQLIAEIRQHPHFEEFLLPPKYSNLCVAAKNGPVILLNYNKMQADAIIILSPSASPIYLCLSHVSVSSIAEHVEKLKNALMHFSIHSREIRHGKLYNNDISSSNEVLDSVASWIWTAIVKPIFDVLNENGINDGRLWWCPSGPFTYLPLHAAVPVECNFIQSYTPTLATLIRSNAQQLSSHTNDILTVVGVAKTSAEQGIRVKLPFVKNEINSVISIFGHCSQKLYNSQATIENVVKKMQTSSWLHIASHGLQDPTDPLKSSLMLYNGRLELSQIIGMNFPAAKFVYLSACETAMGDSKLMNEAMHLAGGFLAAGFQGAIGTLWSMTDAHGPMIAEVVYKTILGEDNIPNVRMAAEGLHLAIQKIRREGAPHHQWMPFIHLGI